MAEIVYNNKVHSVTNILPFIANYGRKLRMGVDIKRKGKVEKATEFVEWMRKVQEEAEVVLRKAQEMKRQADRRQKEVKKWMKEDKVMLSMKDLVFKEEPVKKLIE